MINKLLYWFNVAFDTADTEYNGKKNLSRIQWNLIVTTVQCCGKMNNGLKQYYADLLMLTLLEEGRL